MNHTMIFRWSLVTAILLAVGGGLTASADPIPQKPDFYTTKNYKEDFSKALRKWLPEAYKEWGKRDPKWDQQAIELLEEYCRTKAESTGHLAYEKLAEMGKSLFQQGCDDPVVSYAYGSSLLASKSYQKAFRFSNLAERKLAGTNYPSLQRYLVLSNKALVEKHAGKKHTHPKTTKMLCEVMAKAINEDYLGRQDSRFFWNMMYDDLVGLKPRFQRSVFEETRKSSNDDRWLVQMVLGRYYIGTAWRQRGGGWAHTVTQAGWQGFRANLDEARRHLWKAHELEPSFPEAATEMIEVAMGSPLPDGDTRDWFDRAVERQFDWFPAYKKYLWSIRPRWGGSHEKMYQFGLDCAESHRYDTKVPWQLVVALEEIRHDLDGEWTYYRKPEVFEEFENVLENLAKAKAEAGDASQADWYWSQLMGIAWKLGRYDDARAALDQLKGAGEDTALEMIGLSAAPVYADVLASTGPYKDRLSKIGQILWNQGDMQSVIDLCEGIVRENQDERVKVYYEGLLALSNAHADFHAGKRVELKFDETMPGWHFVHGRWKVTTDGKLVGTSNRAGEGLLAFLPFFPGDRFEVEAEITKAEHLDYVGESGALCLGSMQGNDIDWSSFRWSPERKILDYLPKFENYAKETRTANLVWPSKLRLEVWEGKFDAYLNDSLVFAQRTYPRSDSSPTTIGLGSDFTAPHFELVYENIWVRRLTQRPQSETIRYQLFMEKVHEHLDRKETLEAHELLETAEPFQEEGFEYATQSIEFLKRSLENRKRIEKAKWVDLLEFAKDPKDWWEVKGKGKWKREEGVITFQPTVESKDESGRLELGLELDDFEISMQVDWGGGKEEEESRPIAMFEFGVRRHAMPHYVFYYDPDHKPKGYWLYQLRSPLAGGYWSMVRKLSPPPAQIRIRKSEERIELFQNEELIIEVTDQNPLRGNYCFTAIGTHPGDFVRFSDIKIKVPEEK